MDKSLDKLAVLYADVCGSTRLYEQYGDEIARADMAACLEILSNVSSRFGGETIKTIGDEIMCAFKEPVKAALVSGEMHAALKTAGDAGKFQMGSLHIKIGWHYGGVAWRVNELIGEASVAAQQVINLAKPDEILTSKQTIDALPPGMFPGAHVIDRIEAEAWDGDLEVYKIPWEQTGDETQIAPQGVVLPTASKAGLTLEYDGQQIRIDAANTRCRIGRGKGLDLRVNGSLTSRQHAEIAYRNGRFSLRDESVNGTVVIDESGAVKKLRREEGILRGAGRIGFGASPDDEPEAAVQFWSD